MHFIKKYWFLALLAFIATTLAVINFFLPEKQPQPTNPPVTQESIWKGVVPGQTKQEELFALLGAPDPKQSDFSTGTLAYQRSEGARLNLVSVSDNPSTFALIAMLFVTIES